MQAGNQTEFAEFMGVGKSRVSQWKGAGLLELLPDGQVDFQASKAKIDAATDPAYDFRRNRPQNEQGAQRQQDADETLRQAKARLAFLQAEEKDLELKKLRGSLISLDKLVEDVCEPLARLRSDIEAIPSQIGLSFDQRNAFQKEVDAAFDRVAHDLDPLVAAATAATGDGVGAENARAPQPVAVV